MRYQCSSSLIFQHRPCRRFLFRPTRIVNVFVHLTIGLYTGNNPCSPRDDVTGTDCSGCPPDVERREIVYNFTMSFFKRRLHIVLFSAVRNISTSLYLDGGENSWSVKNHILKLSPRRYSQSLSEALLQLFFMFTTILLGLVLLQLPLIHVI